MMRASGEKGGTYAWYVAVLLSLAHLVSFIDRFLMSLVLVPIKEQFHLSDTQLGLLHGSGFVILYSIAALPLGRLADIGNRRLLIIGGILFWSLATAATGFANSFGTLFAARVGVGLGEASLVPAAMSLIASYFAKDKLARAVSIFTVGASLGKSAALIGGGGVLLWLIARGGLAVPGFGHFVPWQALFILASLLGLVLALLMLTVREPKRPKTSEEKPSLRVAFRYVRQQNSAYLTHVLAATGAILGVQTIAAWSPTFYVRMFGLTPAESGFYVGMVFLAAGPLGHLGGGYLTDKLHTRGVRGAPGVVIGLSLLLAIGPAILFCTTRDFTLSLIAFGFLACFLTAAAPPGLSGIQMMTPERLRGIMSAAFLCIITLVAVGLGPTMIGVITDQVFADEQALHWSLLVALVTYSSLGAVVAWISRTPTTAAFAAAALVNGESERAMAEEASARAAVHP